MPRIIVKVVYTNSRKYNLNYMQYISTREGVEKLDEVIRDMPATEKQLDLIRELLTDHPEERQSEEFLAFVKHRSVGTASELISSLVEEHSEDLEIYMNYIATRPRAERESSSHGLFSASDTPLDLEAEKERLREHRGNVWKLIVSLGREDAERLGYNNAAAWKELLDSKSRQLAEAMKIPPDAFRWYAAFHNERHHPHIHMMIYSDDPRKGFLTEHGLEAIKSELGNAIFMDELQEVFKKMTHTRDDLVQAARVRVHDLIDTLRTAAREDTVHGELIGSLMLRLSEELSQVSGRKVYAYLPGQTKELVNEITSLLSREPSISELYNLWWEQKTDSLRTYTDTIPDCPDLSDNEVFRPIKNAIIRAASEFTAAEESPTEETPPLDQTVFPEEFEDPEEAAPPEDEAEPPPPDIGSTWWSEDYKMARMLLYGTKNSLPDPDRAFELMRALAEKQNGYAMYDLGKMLLNGLGCTQDEAEAQQWFSKSYEVFISAEATSQKPDYLQYRIGKLYSFGHGVEQDYSKAAAWYEKSVSAGNPFAAYSLGLLYRRAQGVRQDDKAAFDLFTMAADHKKKPNAYASYELGKILERGIAIDIDPISSPKRYAQAYRGFLNIEQKMPDDKLYYRLGMMNLQGKGIPVNPGLAKEYLEKAVELNNTDALYSLGKLYLNQDLQEYNPRKAADCLMKAADNGHVAAQYTLGKMLLNGTTEVERSIQSGIQYLTKAAEADSTFAMYTLGKAYLTPELRNTALAESYLIRAASGGNDNANYLLGKTYLFDPDFPKKRSEGISILKSCADRGNIYAELSLNHLQNRMMMNLFGSIGSLFCNAFRQTPPPQQADPERGVDRRLKRQIQLKKKGMNYEE